MKTKTLLFLIFTILYNSIFSQVINTRQYENVVNTGSKQIYKDGVSKIYYIENGISVTTSINLLEQYGKYYQIHIEIENLTGSDFVFNPSDIVALMTDYKTDPKTKVITIDKQTRGVILSSDEYMKKVQRNQNLQSALYGLGAYGNASSAGYSSSTTTTVVSGYSNSYGAIDNYYNGKYTGESVVVGSSTYGSAAGKSVTNSYNGQAAYQAREDAARKTEKFDNELYQVRSELNQQYLKINTIEHRQRLKGSVNLKYEDVERIELLIPVNGKYYSFVYNTRQQSTPQQQTGQTNNKIEISKNAEVNSLYTKGMSHFNNKRFEESLTTFDEALKIEPNNIYLLANRATLNAYYLNNKEQALIDLSKAIDVDSANKSKFNNYLAKASIEHSLKKFNEMNADATAAINLNPEKIDGYFYRALAKSSLNDNRSAISDYEKIISISNKSFKTTDNLGTVYNNLAYCYIQVNEFDKAKPLMDKAIELQPNYSYVWGSRGEYYYKIGEYKKCIEDMNTAIQIVENGVDMGISSDPSVPYYYRALANIKRGKTKDICPDLKKAIEKGKNEATALINQYCK